MCVSLADIFCAPVGQDGTQKLCEQLANAAKMGDTQTVQNLVEKYQRNPHTYHAPTFETLVGNAFWRSCENGHLECAQILQVLSQEDDMLQALFGACENGQADVVKFLIPMVKMEDPYWLKSVLLRSIKGNSLDVLKMVTPYVKSKTHRTEALREACQANNRAAFDFLYPLSNPQSALKYMEKRKTLTDSEKQMLKDAIGAEQQKIVLSEAVGEVGGAKRKMKM